MSILSLIVAPQIVKMTTFGTTSEDKIDIP